MKTFAGILLWLPLACLAQDYSTFTGTLQAFYRTSNQKEADSIYNYLASRQQIPLIVEDSVAFFYKGDARKVTWMGDFNGWGRDASYNTKGTRIGNTNIWHFKTTFPKDARLDYKILLNEMDWIIDPVNPLQQWSGVGGGSPNSEIRMPLWKPDPVTRPREGIPKGKLEPDKLFASSSLGYQITYSVYFPPSYQPGQQLPVLYVTDGYEYLHEKMGNMKVILDNLFNDQLIRPIIVVFIDHREPVNRSNNKRMWELAMNSKYLNFMTSELVPHVEQQLNLQVDPRERGIMGTSMGGLTAAYFAFSTPQVFGLAGIQSPAFWFKPEIYNFCDTVATQPVKIIMTSGTVHDAREGSLKMKSILEKNACTYEYLETSQGHSWGNFRDSIDDILVFLYPTQ